MRAFSFPRIGWIAILAAGGGSPPAVRWRAVLLPRERHNFPGFPLQIDPLVLIGNAASIGGDSDRRVPERLDGPVFVREMGQADRFRFRLAEAIGEEFLHLVLIANLRAPGGFDAGDDGVGRFLRICLDCGSDLIEPTAGRAGAVADADFLIAFRAPDHAIHADIIEEEGCDAQAGRADFAIPDEEAARQAARLPMAAIGNLDAVLLVREKDEHIAVARIERGIPLIDIDRLAEFAGDSKFSIDAIAEALDQGFDNIMVPDAAILRAGGGGELGEAILADERADLIDRAALQAEIQIIGCDIGRERAEISGRGLHELAELAEAMMGRHGRAFVRAHEDERFPLFIFLDRPRFQNHGRNDFFAADRSLIFEVRQHRIQAGEALIIGASHPFAAGFHKDGHIGFLRSGAGLPIRAMRMACLPSGRQIRKSLSFA